MSPKPPSLRPNHRKILEAILYLIENASARSLYVTQYDIVKSLFVADLFHLEKYGRPVTFDNYSAMEFGPVPREAYDMLKPSYDGKRFFGDPWPLWDRMQSPRDGKKAFKFINPKRPSNPNRLSESDLDELRDALTIVKQLGFGGLVDWTHKNPSYVAAWKPAGGKGSYPMEYALLSNCLEDDMVADLAHASKFM